VNNSFSAGTPSIRTLNVLGNVVFVNAHTGGAVTLRISVNKQDRFPHPLKHSKVNAGRCLAYAAFLIKHAIVLAITSVFYHVYMVFNKKRSIKTNFSRETF
jgi:hypothetical protein